MDDTPEHPARGPRPWSHTPPRDQTMPRIADDLRQALSSIALGELYGVSRNTGDTWVERSLKHRPLGLEDRSRQPHSSSWPPTWSRAPIARATSQWATGSPVIRPSWPRATAACTSAVEPSLPPVWLTPRPCAPASSKRAVCPNASAPTTGCPVPPIPWAGSHHAPPGDLPRVHRAR
jgi:hypothetical protein